MHISCGATRLVVVTKSGAYKIAMIGFPVYILISLFRRERRKNLIDRYAGKDFLTVVPKRVFRNIFGGILVNRNEYLYYKKTFDPRVIATKRIYLGGLVVLQEGASPVPAEGFVNPLASYISQEGFLEIASPNQFGEYGGKVLLLDYGEKETCNLLESTLA